MACLGGVECVEALNKVESIAKSRKVRYLEMEGERVLVGDGLDMKVGG